MYDDCGSTLQDLTSPKLDDRRRSDTTVSSYNDATTPETDNGQFELFIKPVEGPQGPHLFRASQMSADFMLDFALQMSPLEVKTPRPVLDTSESVSALAPRPSTSTSHRSRHQHGRRSMTPVMVDLPGLPANIHDWTSADVADWLYNAAVDMSSITAFRSNDITGTVLADMDFDDLKDLGIQSFGKRHEVWTLIEDLTGDRARPSPVATPFQDLQEQPNAEVDEFEFPRSACSSTSIEDLTPVEDGHRRGKRSRRSRSHRRGKPRSVDQIDLGRMSFLAIEEKLPQEHICDKGHECPKWKRWQKRVQKAKDFNERLNSNAACSVTYTTSQNGPLADKPCGRPRNLAPVVDLRPISEGVPSVVASSDVFGPSELPDFALHEAYVQQLEKRDPQENVKAFLHFQHVSSPLDAPGPLTFSPLEPDEAPLPVEVAFQPHGLKEDGQLEMFPPSFYNPPCAQPPHAIPHEHLKFLPRLSIPRAATTSPSLVRRHGSIISPISPQSAGRSAVTADRNHAISPLTVSRVGTPASEMDLPVTAPPVCPIQRDFSYSVPPNMLYRNQIPVSRPTSTRPDHGRKPSFPLPALAEVLETQSQGHISPQRPSAGPRRSSDASSQMSAVLQKTKDLYGEDCTHAGWMKKRRTKLLRHEWQESHFRLNGTQLAMHSSNRQTSAAKETIDVDDYTVNCSTGAANSKLSAALKTLRIRDDDKREVDPSSFNFQLVPEIPVRRKGLGLSQGKTHHFAVTSRDDRMDWMREVMLAKAASAKGQRSRTLEPRMVWNE